MDALLERLGFQPSKYEFVASDQEFEYSMKRAQIEKLLYEKEMFRLAGKPCRSMKTGSGKGTSAQTIYSS